LRALCHGDASQEQQSFDVVDDVCQSDFNFCPGDADGADERIHPVLLLGENMLNLGADFRFRVGTPDRAAHGAPLWLFAMDMADEAVLSHELFVGRRIVADVGPKARLDRLALG